MTENIFERLRPSAAGHANARPGQNPAGRSWQCWVVLLLDDLDLHDLAGRAVGRVITGVLDGDLVGADLESLDRDRRLTVLERGAADLLATVERGDLACRGGVARDGDLDRGR